MHVRIAILSAIFAAVSGTAQAGFLIGSDGGNDSKANVLAVIVDYNSTHDPDLSTTFDLFKKSDDDSAFVFNPANGFAFFSDAAGTNPVLTHGALTSLTTAYFSYSGPASLLYYSVKASGDFSVYSVLVPGLNTLNAGTHAISHVSFWEGPRPTGGPLDGPEPASAVLFLMGAAGIGASRRLRRQA